MPLPCVTHYVANQCQATSKRTGLPCNNPAAFGCRTCRMHGAHRSRRGAEGVKHWNYQHGKEIREARANRRETSKRLHDLVDLGNTIGMFQPGTKLKGRRPKEL